jgi:hypothetical protein
VTSPFPSHTPHVPAKPKTLPRQKKKTSNEGLFSVESKIKYEMVKNNLREYNNWRLFLKYVLSGVLMRNLYFTALGSNCQGWCFVSGDFQ